MTPSPLNSPPLARVILAGAGPGDPDLLTRKALRALDGAEVILHDVLVDQRILAEAPHAVLINVGKRCGRHAMSQPEICALLVEYGKTGARVLRLKGGDPMIFGRANEEIAALRAANIAFDIIPGITAASAAAASLHLSLTARGQASSVTLITGHGSDGTLPKQDWHALARLGGTLAFYMGTRHAAAIADRLIEAGLAPSTPSILITNISRPDQTSRPTDLINLADGLAAQNLTAPALILIGSALSSRPDECAALANARAAPG